MTSNQLNVTGKNTSQKQSGSYVNDMMAHKLSDFTSMYPTNSKGRSVICHRGRYYTRTTVSRNSSRTFNPLLRYRLPIICGLNQVNCCLRRINSSNLTTKRNSLAADLAVTFSTLNLIQQAQCTIWNPSQSQKPFPGHTFASKAIRFLRLCMTS